MGQLERYGLHVLCLVIFLILGVAIWGGDTGPDGKPIEVATKHEQPLDSGDQQLKKWENFLEDRNKTSEKRQEVAESLFENAQPVEPDPNYGSTVIDNGDPKTKPAPIVPPPVAALRTHKVKKGEILGVIAKRYLGRSSRWPKIAELNPGVNPRSLRPGTVLKIPPKEGNQEVQLTSARRDYKVKKGDSPWRIARRHFGAKNTEKYVAAIMQLNGIQDATDLKVGQLIQLPPQ